MWAPGVFSTSLAGCCCQLFGDLWREGRRDVFALPVHFWAAGGRPFVAEEGRRDVFVLPVHFRAAGGRPFVAEEGWWEAP